MADPKESTPLVRSPAGQPRVTFSDVLSETFEDTAQDGEDGETSYKGLPFKTNAISTRLLGKRYSEKGADAGYAAGKRGSGWLTLIYSESTENCLRARARAGAASARSSISLGASQALDFYKSSAGVLWQGLLIFIYMHFDAGLPLLQDAWKMNYGGLDRKLLYTKQTLLITQNFLELLIIYSVAYVNRGSVRDCLNLGKTLKFAPAGMCFGIQAVFGFFAMSGMSADCYALYSQCSIVILTLGWTIFFRTRISAICWVSVLLVAVGIAGFNMSDDVSTSRSLTFIGLKMVTQSFACLYAERFIKSDPERLYIQMAWIKPVELMTTAALMFAIPPKPGQLWAWEEVRDFGFYHHWNWLTVVIMVFNMGDTFMTATIAKKFDSVVKGIAGVFDIIYPTQVVVLLVYPTPPRYTPLKIISGVVIFLGSLQFVLGRGQERWNKDRQNDLDVAQAELEKLKGLA